MKKYRDYMKGHTIKYDLSNSLKLLEEAIQKIDIVRKELSKENIDITDLEEGWNLIDKYYGNVTRGETYKRKNKSYIPNTSAIIPNKGN